MTPPRLFFIAVLACSPSTSAPAATRRDAGTPTKGPATAAVPTTDSKPSTTTETVLEFLIARAKDTSLSPKNVRDRFRVLVELKDDGANSVSWGWVYRSASGFVREVEVLFDAAQPGPLTQITITTLPENRSTEIASATTYLTRALGRPKWRRPKKGTVEAIAWKLRDDWQMVVAVGPDDRLTFAVAEDEPAD